MAANLPQEITPDNFRAEHYCLLAQRGVLIVNNKQFAKAESDREF
jgi:hypothetical protein